MKVGTDGVLLGAWALGGKADTTCDVGHIVDVGCGSGLISLMMAQRFPTARVTGIDIDAPSVQDARANVAASPFAERIDIVHTDFLTLPPQDEAVCYVCNPPFYTEDTIAPDVRRATARHSSALPLDALVKHVARDRATLSLILPTALEPAFLALCHSESLHLHRICHVRTTEHKMPKRVLMEAGMATDKEAERTTLVLTGDDGRRSEAYATLCKDFYL